MAWHETWRFPYEGERYDFDLECLSDWQLGSRSTCLWKIDDTIEEICEKAEKVDSAVVFGGDIEDEDRPSTRMQRAMQAAERLEVTVRDAQKHLLYLESDVLPRLLKLHKACKYGILGGVAGHHWTFLPGEVGKVGEKAYLTSTEYLFARLEQITGKPCRYLGQMVSFLDFRFDARRGVDSQLSPDVTRVTGLLQHGEGGGATKASTLTKLERAAQGFDANFYIRGHDCQLVGTKTDVLYPKETRGGDPAIMSRTKAMLNLGSATMGYEVGRGAPSYIEQAMMRPATMGWGTLHFRLYRASRAEDPARARRCRIKVEI